MRPLVAPPHCYLGLGKLRNTSTPPAEIRCFVRRRDLPEQVKGVHLVSLFCCAQP
jgi:hypothetical protein